jgi:ParB-like chromosome segregation protein Spo0J
VKHLDAQTEIAQISTLRPFVGNPRRGNLEAIIDSLVAHGQYRPIVVNKKTNTIIAGHHVWQAAKQLGWKEIAVTWIDVDEQTAKKILLADNRIADLATYDEAALLEILVSLSDLTGTGFEAEDIEGLISNLTDNQEEPLTELPPIEPELPESQTFKVNAYKWTVDREYYQEWRNQLEDEFEGNRRKITLSLRTSIGLPAPKKKRTEEDDNNAPRDPVAQAEWVDIDTLAPLLENPREGDIGAISESLRLHGQYRPIVARRDGTILVGNHTYKAARALGWKQVMVVWSDVDDEEALKIVLVDNRTSDLGTYDTDELSALLSSLQNWDGTGFDGDDVDAIINGQNPKTYVPWSGRKEISLGEYKFLVDEQSWRIFETALPSDKIELELMERIGLAAEYCQVNGERVA